MHCHPYIKWPRVAPSTTWSVPELAAAYKWPTTGAPQWPNPLNRPAIAIIELGGGWVLSDMEQYFAAIGQPMPTIVNVSVDGTENTHQSPQSDADYEVALDIQVAAAAYFAATGQAAHIRVYWSQDIAAAVHKAKGDGCSVCSISWGADEASWGSVAGLAMESAAAAATELGMTIFAAAGDNDSSDGGENAANVDCPGSCPHVVCCGGTSKTRTTETVWQDNPGETDGNGTGGGYSTLFGIQAWQKNAPIAPLTVPGDAHPGRGRLVPDVAANADPDTGYEIVVYGQQQIVGGTSAVAPLYAGLCAALGKKVGFITPTLWANPGAFADITVGSNGSYFALVGPDACSGLGAPRGAPILKALG
jgi:kumamolisin